MVWLQLLFWGVVFPITNITCQKVARGHDLRYFVIVTAWFAMMNGILMVAAILLFKLNKND